MEWTKVRHRKQGFGYVVSVDSQTQSALVMWNNASESTVPLKELQRIR